MRVSKRTFALCIASLTLLTAATGYARNANINYQVQLLRTSYGIPHIQAGDLALIAQRLDFLGINYYSRNLVGAQGNLSPVPGSEYTDMGWEVCAPALRRLLKHLNADYHLPPIYITENGAAFPDEVSADGRVHDPRRLCYLRDHLTAVVP